jgi:hypothetical protein
MNPGRGSRRFAPCPDEAIEFLGLWFAKPTSGKLGPHRLSDRVQRGDRRAAYLQLTFVYKHVSNP